MEIRHNHRKKEGVPEIQRPLYEFIINYKFINNEHQI